MFNQSSRNFLLTTPRGLSSLRKVQARVDMTGPHGPTSTEGAFLDAHTAHRLQGLLAALARASCEVARECQPRAGKKGAALQSVSKKGLANLAAALKATQTAYLSNGRIARPTGGSR